MKKIGIIAILLFILLAIAFGIFVSLKTKTPDTLSGKALLAAELAGNYLVRHQHEDGHFDYVYSPETGEVSDAYNMLRHAGTTFALLQLFGVTEDEKYLQAGESGLSYIFDKTSVCPTNSSNTLCMYDGEKAKIGGNALAILAIVEHVRATGETKNIETAKKLGEWIVDSQNEFGEYTPHIIYRNQKVSDHVSEYYPGEAIFALMKLHEITGDDKWLNSARRAIDWLIFVRDKDKTIEDIIHDHWLLYGLSEFVKYEKESAYIEHAKKIVDAIISEQNIEDVPKAWVGGFKQPPQTTSSATRGEGLGSAYEIFSVVGDSEYKEKTLDSLEKVVTFELYQFIDGPRARTYKEPMQALGGFNESFEESEIRIDNVQHNISSLLGYYKIKK